MDKKEIIKELTKKGPELIGAIDESVEWMTTTGSQLVMESIMTKVKAGTATPSELIEAARSLAGVIHHLRLARDVVGHMVTMMLKDEEDL